jgi:hypothetical protein
LVAAAALVQHLAMAVVADQVVVRQAATRGPLAQAVQEHPVKDSQAQTLLRLQVLVVVAVALVQLQQVAQVLMGNHQALLEAQ